MGETLVNLLGCLMCVGPIILGGAIGIALRKRRLLGSAGVRSTDDVSELDQKTMQRLSQRAPGEELLHAVRCEHGASNFGWLIATDRRIWWFATALMHQGEEAEFSYDWAVDIRNPGPIGNSRTLIIGDAQFQMSREDAETMSLIVRQQRDAADVATSATSSPGASTADEIAKFAEMRAQGILTDAEFEEQKRQLLGR